MENDINQFNDPKQMELSACRKEAGDCEKEIRITEATLNELQSNKNYSNSRKSVLQRDLNLLMLKINQDYANRWQYSTEEGNYRRDIAQAQHEEQMADQAMLPLNQKMSALKRQRKLLKKKEKRINTEITTGMTISRSEEDGSDNPMGKKFEWVMNMLGENAGLKMVGLMIGVALLFMAVFF